jgi:hypothetical protein
MMATIDWDQLNSIQEWAEVLKTLLADAKNAIADNDLDAKLSAQQQLLEFIKESPQRCSFLDDIANKAAHDLFLDTVAACLQGIASRNAELQQATKIISGVTDEANSDAKTLLLTDVKSGLDKITAGLTKLQTAATGDKNLLDRIKGVQDAIAAFKA